MGEVVGAKSELRQPMSFASELVERHHTILGIVHCECSAISHYDPFGISVARLRRHRGSIYYAMSRVVFAKTNKVFIISSTYRMMIYNNAFLMQCKVQMG
jgi:hypothetical protein